MKRTLNINLAGYPFTIDEDAYNLLKDYLDTIKYAFDTQDDTVELAADIESRIAEILIENEGGGIRIVSLEEISRVIDRIGKPSEFIEIEENVKSQSSGHPDKLDEEEIKMEEMKISPPPYYSREQYPRNSFTRKKLFRDPQDSMLGGVCSGLAHYLNIDVTIMRLITVVLFFLSASTVAIAYIVLWIVVPQANTPYQRMQMMGEDPTVENIGKTVTDNHRGEDTIPNSQVKKSGFQGFLSSALSVFIKCLIIIGLIVAIPILIAAGAAILGCLIAIFVISIGIVSGGMFESVNEGLMVLYILLAVVGGAITVGVPLWLFIRNFWNLKNNNLNPASRRALLIVWLCGIALVSVFTVKAVKKERQIDKSQWGTYLKDYDFEDEEIRDIDISKGAIVITTDGGKKIRLSRDTVTVETLDNIKSIETRDTVAIQDSILEVSIIQEIKKDSIN